MTLSLAALATLMLLLPGVGFVVGVNLADKNVREIVFRNTPAELAYVVVTSIVVHLLFVLLFSHFNAAGMLLRFAKVSGDHSVAAVLDARAARNLLIFSLEYFLATTAAGTLPGLILGRAVRFWRLEFFAKHRWMLRLVGVRRGDVVFAHVLLTPYFTDEAKGNHTIAIEGILADNFFGADGALLYLVFSNYQEVRVPLAGPTMRMADASPLFEDGESEDNRLVIEGKAVLRARYYRLPRTRIRSAGDALVIQQFVEKDPALRDDGL